MYGVDISLSRYLDPGYNPQSHLKRLRQSDATIREILAVSGTPSISYAVARGEKTIRTAHFGFRDIAGRIPSDDHTRYNINSMSKGIISVLAAILADEGILDLEAPVRNYLPEFACKDPSLTDKCSIIDMLSHRTGITSFDQNWLGADNVFLAQKSETLRIFAALNNFLPFRASFVYNNWGYEIVGLIIERLTATPLGQLLQDRIFQPLGMTRTSTSWGDHGTTNHAKSYAVLHDLSPVEILRPDPSPGTVMEVAGGVKSTIHDLIIFYREYLRAIVDQHRRGSDRTSHSIFRRCRQTTTHHAHLGGFSLYEQGYSAGLARAQLPGQLGCASQNPVISEEPVVGKTTRPNLILYHHGSLPGSTTNVYMVPAMDLVLVVLQNSLAPIDTADFVAQHLLEVLLTERDPNDYVALSKKFTSLSLGHMDRIKEDLDDKRKPDTNHRDLGQYTGEFHNEDQTFLINVFERDNHLYMQFQGKEKDVYRLSHYEDDIFSWWMPYDEVARRGRYVNDFTASFYLIAFAAVKSDDIDTIQWSWDPNLPDNRETFNRKEKVSSNL